MADVKIPGAELERAASNMERVLALLGVATSPPGLEQMLGDGTDVLRAARAFDKRWDDGHIQLEQEAGDIQKALKQVLEAFTTTDNQAADALEGKAPDQ